MTRPLALRTAAYLACLGLSLALRLEPPPPAAGGGAPSEEGSAEEREEDVLPDDAPLLWQLRGTSRPNARLVSSSSAEDEDLAPGQPDVWLYMAHRTMTLAKNMYTPVLLSLQSALESERAVTRIVDAQDREAMLSGVRRRGKGTPLIVGVALQQASASSLEVLKQCVEAGALLVAYSTEPADDQKFSKLAISLGAQEVWEYARSNMRGYRQQHLEHFRLRYVPPAYTPRLEVGVDLRSPERQEQSIGFIGGLTGRPKNIQLMYADLLGSSLVPTNKVWSDEDLRRFLNKYPLQLNVHKYQTCCPHQPNEAVAMEAFRLAPLLSNGACVVSTPAPEEDRALWDGIVHFAEVDHTAAVLRQLRRNVTDCQVQARALYKERFDANRLLRQSGFLDTWTPPSLKW